jgi:hypothetical protein
MKNQSIESCIKVSSKTLGGAFYYLLPKTSNRGIFNMKKLCCFQVVRQTRCSPSGQGGALVTAFLLISADFSLEGIPGSIFKWTK